MALALTLDEFKALRKNSQAVVVFLTSKTCGPCKSLYGIFEEMSSDCHPMMDMFKVDVDLSPEVSEYCEVRSIPAFRFYHQGKLITSFTGASKTKLVDGCNTLIALLPDEDEKGAEA